MLWREVLVPAHVVGSDGLTAEIGGEVEMPLAFSCRYRTCASQRDQTAAARPVSDNFSYGDHRRVYDLFGRVAEVDGCRWPDGWMIDVGGLGIYVSEVGASPAPGPRTFSSSREAGSDPPIPVPAPGTWVLARGELSIAEAYETELFEPAGELLRRAVRRWHVRRIVRLDDGADPRALSPRHGQDVAVMRFDDLRRGDGRTTIGYLLDLESLSPARTS